MVDVGNLIAFLGLLCAIVLPIAVALFNDIGCGLKLDRHLIIGRIFNLPLFMAAALLMCVFILVAITAPVESIGLFWSLLIGYVVIYFIVIFHILFNSARWLNSEDFSSSSHASYKENQRLKYLTSSGVGDSTRFWHEFWLDSQTYEYLGDDHIYPYIKTFLQYISAIKPKDRRFAEDLFQDFSIAFLRLCKLDDPFLSACLLPDLLGYFEHSCIADDYQQGLWASLIQQYLRMFYFQEEASYHECLNEEHTKDDPFIPLIGDWRMTWESCLTSGRRITDPRAIRRLTTAVCDCYLTSFARTRDEEIKYLQSCGLISSGESKKFYHKLVNSLKANNSAILADYLISRAEYAKEHPENDDI